MPKSKRNRVVSLTATRKKGKEFKNNLIADVKESADSFQRVFVFSYSNMRNSKLKDLKQDWKLSRFFFGKNKVVGFALGRTPEDEYRDNIHHLSHRLHGQRGLLFTNQSKEQVLQFFKKYSVPDFARTGDIATETIILEKGALEQFPHSLEPHLRDLGLSTSLQRGVVTLTKDHVVCKEGDALTSDQVRILKLLEKEMAEFKLTIECMWSNEGKYEEFVPIEEGKKRKLVSSEGQKKKRRRLEKPPQKDENEEEEEEPDHEAGEEEEEEDEEEEEVECN